MYPVQNALVKYLIYILVPLPYIAIFMLALFALCIYGIHKYPAVLISVIFSLAINFTFTVVLNLNAIEYSFAAASFALKVLPTVTTVGIIAFIPNAKAIIGAKDDENSSHIRRIIVSLMLVALVISSVIILCR